MRTSKCAQLKFSEKREPQGRRLRINKSFKALEDWIDGL